MQFLDLHTHSTASDGTLTPTELVAHALVIGLSAVALTDHDTTDGVKEAIRAASAGGLLLIPGVEFEVALSGDDDIAGSCHLLGLGIEPSHQRLQDRLRELRAGREHRNRRIIARMRASGFDVDYEEVLAYSNGKLVTRPHIARYLVDNEIARDEVDAFQTFLGDDGEFFEPRIAFDMDKTIDLIHDAGGKAILAHPQTLFVSWNGLVDRLARWKRLGLDGVEGFHPGVTWTQGRRISEAATALGLLCTAGSDFHGPHRADRKLGRTSDGHRIAVEFAAGIPGAERLVAPESSVQRARE